VSGSEAGSPVHEKGSGRQNLMKQEVNSGTYRCDSTENFTFPRQVQLQERKKERKKGLTFVTRGRRVRVCILAFLSFRIWNGGRKFQ
jgi:hypothetical protein